MAALASAAYTVFVVIKYAGAVYLLYLAYRLWTAPADTGGEPVGTAPQSRFSLFLAGLMLTLGNPKVMVFFLALLPAVMDLTNLGVTDYLRVAVAITVILASVLCLYTVAAFRARRVFRTAKAVRWLNRGTGTMMAGAAVTVASQ